VSIYQVLSVFLLNLRLVNVQKIALVLLVLGLVTSKADLLYLGNQQSELEYAWWGYALLLVSGCCSGLAGVSNEYLIKKVARTTISSG